MTDQPKKTLEEAKVNEAKVLANDPLPAPLYHSRNQPPKWPFIGAASECALFHHNSMYSKSCSNYISYHQISQDLFFLMFFSSPVFFIPVSPCLALPKFGKSQKY